MKKIITLILALTMALLSFTACGNSKKDDDDEKYSISDFKKNLENAGYAVVNVDEDQIDQMFDMLKLDDDDYKIKKAITASNSNTNVIHIFETSSTSNAKKLANDLEAAFDDAGYFFTIEKEGSFVLTGDPVSIEDAKKSSSSSDKTPATPTISQYQKNLENAGYTIQLFSDEQTDDLFDVLNLDSDDYSIRNMFSANTQSGGVSVIECGSQKLATKLSHDLSAAYEDLYGEYISSAMKIETAGAILLVGNSEAINDAKNETPDNIHTEDGGIHLPIIDPDESESQTSLSEIEETLRKSAYSVYYVKDAERIKEAILDLDLEPKLYNVKTIFGAENSSGKRIVVFECNSSDDAKDLAEDINYPDKLETMFSNTTPKTLEVRGNLLIIGDNEAVNALK